MSYVPILKYKERVDMSAYIKHDMNDKDITPMIEVFQSEKFPLDKINDDKRFYLGILFESSMKFYDAVNHFIAAKELFPNMIPVINSDYNFDSKKETFRAFQKLTRSFENIAFKFNNIKSFYMHQNLESIMLMYDKIAESDIFLDIDYAYKYSATSIMDYMQQSIKVIRDSVDEGIDKFIVTGSIIRVTSSYYSTIDENGGRPAIIQNNLLDAFSMMRAKYPYLKYADYTIDEKHVFTSDESTATSFYPMVKYTIPSGEIAVYKSGTLRGFDDYKDIAAMISSESYFNTAHCAGCRYVTSIVNGTEGGKGTGSPTTWKLNSMIHHIATMGELLSNP